MSFGLEIGCFPKMLKCVEGKSTREKFFCDLE